MLKRIVKLESQVFELASLKVPKWEKTLTAIHAAGPKNPKKRGQFRVDYILAQENLERIESLRKKAAKAVRDARTLYGKAELAYNVDEDRSQVLLRSAKEHLDFAEEYLEYIDEARKLRKQYAKKLQKLAK